MGTAPPSPRSLIGLALAGVFVVGGLVVREIEPLEEQVSKVLDFADQGSIPILVLVTAVNGVAEEMFFRGAAYDAIPRQPVLWTTVANAVATAAAGNLMLAFAALLLGAVVGLERRATGGIPAPVLTHVTWSVTMLFALPALFGCRWTARRPRRRGVPPRRTPPARSARPRGSTRR